MKKKKNINFSWNNNQLIHTTRHYFKVTPFIIKWKLNKLIYYVTHLYEKYKLHENECVI